MTQPLISVIVPVYNAADSLEFTVKALTRQTYRNLEILLIDDGSADDSPKICDRLASSDNRVKVIHQSNAGVSAARNTGLAAASGEYIGFCDADDYPCPTMFERLYSVMTQNGCDGIHSTFFKQYEGKTDLSVEGQQGTVEVKSRDESVKWILTKKSDGGTAVWCHLFKSCVIKELSFPVGIAIGEDKRFLIDAFLRCGKVAFYSGKEYVYIVRKSSVVHSSYGIKHLSSIIITDETTEMIQREYPEYSDYSVVNTYKVYLSNIRNINHFDTDDAEVKEFYKRIVGFLKQKTPRYVRQYLSYRMRFELSLIKLSVPLFKSYAYFKEKAGGAIKS